MGVREKKEAYIQEPQPCDISQSEERHFAHSPASNSKHSPFTDIRIGDKNK